MLDAGWWRLSQKQVFLRQSSSGAKAPPISRELAGRKWEVFETEDWPSSALSAVGLHNCVYRD